MAYDQQQPVKITLVAAADLTTSFGKFVKIVAGQAAAVTAGADRAIGVLANKPKAGQEAEIVVLGVTKMIASAAMAVGDSVGNTADGRAVTNNTAASVNNLGTVLLANSAANGFVTVTVNCLNQTR